jgi:menaquinone-dependent protoporphyrinogen oxidase
MTVLVAAASKHGATGEIAARIGARLAEHGVDVQVKNLEHVTDISGYDAFVIGSGIYLGTWLKDARRFLDEHADELAQRPTWLFASGSIVGDPRVADDPNALRAGLADRLVELTHAREHKLFAGKLDTNTLGLFEKIAVGGAHASEGDHRDWQASTFGRRNRARTRTGVPRPRAFPPSGYALRSTSGWIRVRRLACYEDLDRVGVNTVVLFSLLRLFRLERRLQGVHVRRLDQNGSDIPAAPRIQEGRDLHPRCSKNSARLGEYRAYGARRPSSWRRLRRRERSGRGERGDPEGGKPKLPLWLARPRLWGHEERRVPSGSKRGCSVTVAGRRSPRMVISSLVPMVACRIGRYANAIDVSTV